MVSCEGRYWGFQIPIKRHVSRIKKKAIIGSGTCKKCGRLISAMEINNKINVRGCRELVMCFYVDGRVRKIILLT